MSRAPVGPCQCLVSAGQQAAVSRPADGLVTLQLLSFRCGLNGSKQEELSFANLPLSRSLKSDKGFHKLS